MKRPWSSYEVDYDLHHIWLSPIERVIYTIFRPIFAKVERCNRAKGYRQGLDQGKSQAPKIDINRLQHIAYRDGYAAGCQYGLIKNEPPIAEFRFGK